MVSTNRYHIFTAYGYRLRVIGADYFGAVS